MVRINPVTLQFDDGDMEGDLRSGTLDASYGVLVLFFILDISCRFVMPVTEASINPTGLDSDTGQRSNGRFRDRMIIQATRIGKATDPVF